MITLVDVHVDESETEALLRAVGPTRTFEVLTTYDRRLPPGVVRQLLVGVEALEMGDTPDPRGSGASTPWTPPQRSGPGTVP